MVHNNLKRLAVLAAACGFLFASEAMAADVTDVNDAFDEVYLGNELTKDPFDITLEAKFVQHRESAKLKREGVDKDDHTVHLYNELVYKRIINTVDLDLEAGLYHDLSLHVGLPIVISDQRSYELDTTDNANLISMNGLHPSFFATTAYDGYKYFDMQDNKVLNGKKRSGVGDLTVGIKWSPFNSERSFIPDRGWGAGNTGRSTFTLGFDYIAPTGKTQQIENSGVGMGAHNLLFSVAASHRFPIVDPYIRLQFDVPVRTADYKNYGRNQVRDAPGMWGRIDLGLEFVPYESIALDFQRFVKIDLRAYFKYNAEGRVYSEIGDAFGTADYYKADSGLDLGEKGWIGEKWSNAGDRWMEFAGDVTGLNGGKAANRNLPLKEDGYFDYEGFATIGGAINLIIQPVQYVSIIGGFAAEYQQNHFVTFTKIGKDRLSWDSSKGDNGDFADRDSIGGKDPHITGDGKVTDTLIDERSPVFSKALDAPGKRIKRTETFNLEWFVGLRLMY